MQFPKPMQHIQLVFQGLGFALGFWWVSYQKEIELQTILRSVIGGLCIGAAGLWVWRFYTHAPQMHLAYLMPASLLGATALLWFLAGSRLAQKMSRDEAYLLCLTFAYCFSQGRAGDQMVAIFGAVPCLLVLICTFSAKHLNLRGRVGLMFGTMVVSLAVGTHKIWISPGDLMPSTATGGLAGGLSCLHMALAAASLVTLALNLVPFMDWVWESLIGDPNAANHEVKNNTWSMQKALVLTVIHGAPLLLNWKYRYFSYDSMLSYALIYSPIVTARFAESLGPAEKSEMPWERDVTRAS